MGGLHQTTNISVVSDLLRHEGDRKMSEETLLFSIFCISPPRSITNNNNHNDNNNVINIALNTIIIRIIIEITTNFAPRSIWLLSSCCFNMF